MDAVVGAYTRALAHPAAIAEIAAELGQWYPASLCNGYWHGEPGMRWIEAAG